MLGPDGGGQSTPFAWGLTIGELSKELDDFSLTRLRRELDTWASSNVARTFPPHIANKAFT
jgi:hypothetical protein